MNFGLDIDFGTRWERQPHDVTLAWERAASDLGGADQPEPIMLDTVENDLLERIAHGDADAFSDLYDRFAGTMFSLAMQILRDGAAAEDVVQEAFVQIWEKASTYDQALGKPMTWAVTLVRNRAIDRLRSGARRQKLAEAVAKETDPTEPVLPGADAALIDSETARQVRLALSCVPMEQRQAIEMAYFGGLTQTEIAAAINVPLGTVKARIRRGMMQMRELLDATLEGHPATASKGIL